MAYAQVTGMATYKGHKIERVESPIQAVYVVDDDRKRGYWSMADAKRFINGKTLIYEPADVNSWFE